MALLAAVRRASALRLQRAPSLLRRRPTLPSARAISFWPWPPSPSPSPEDREDAIASLFRAWTSMRVQVDTLGATLQDFRLERALGSTVQSHVASTPNDLPSLLAQIEATTDYFPFKIIENKCGDDITLTRVLKGEKIKVVISMPSIVEEDDKKKHKSSLSYSSENTKEDDDEGAKDSSRTTMYLVVTVSKSDGSNLEFACFAHPNKIQICNMNMEPPRTKENDQDMATYNGFEGLDDNLEKSLNEYLELRGITPDMMNLLRKYLSGKARQKHMLWLSNLQAFLRKTD